MRTSGFRPAELDPPCKLPGQNGGNKALKDELAGTRWRPAGFFLFLSSPPTDRITTSIYLNLIAWLTCLLLFPFLFRIDPSIRLRRAISANDVLLVKRILKSHPDLLHNPDFSVAGLSNSNLHTAAALGHVLICKLLVARGHEDSGPALNDNHQTALMLASAAGHTEVVLFLCEKCPASITRRDARGRDAIMEASLGGHDTVLQILLTYAPGGATEAVQNADLEGNTALHFASSNGNLLVLRTLLAAGADAERRNIWSWTAIAYSATVQAEVYLKGLVAEVERRRQARRDTADFKKGASVRIVSESDSAD